MIAILTDFVNHDPAYSLCSVVMNQVRMITGAGLALRVIVRPGFSGNYLGAEIIEVDPGRVGSNIVSVDEGSGTEIVSLMNQLENALDGVEVALTHDLIFQPNCWKYHIAARRIAKKRDDLHWYHWVHSATDMGVKGQMGIFGNELEGQFPNSTLVVMHEEELQRKATLYGYQPHQTIIIPNPIDFTDGYHPAALEVIEKAGLWDADCIAVYPCRLDRGKQPHIIIEVFGALRGMGADARVVIVDFHSISGDKAVYREEMKAYAASLGVPLLFTSELEYPQAQYHIPHKAVMDLLEFSDVMIHPSKSESDPLILPEAAWKRCGLVLNFDLPSFHAYQGHALLYKFSSNIDITTGLLGETNTAYNDRTDYMRHVAAGVAYLMSTNPTLYLHAKMRKTRSLKAVWERHLRPALERFTPLQRAEPAEEVERGLASIIIPCYLLPDKDDELYGFTRNCIESIKRHLDNYELVIVDNGSPVHADYLEAEADIHIRNETNLGFAPAVNQGLQTATGEWLIVCNNDIEFLHNWVDKAVGAWKNGTGIVCSHLIDHDPTMSVGREVLPHVGYFFGALWMIRRDMLDEIGLLSEEFEFGHFEDKDLANRVIQAGYELVKTGHVRHIGNATWGKLPDQQEIYLRNKERFEAKWPSA